MKKLILVFYLTISSLLSFAGESLSKELIIEVIEGAFFVGDKRVTNLEAYLIEIENLDEYSLNVIAYEDMSFYLAKDIANTAKRLGIKKTTLSIGREK